MNLCALGWPYRSPQLLAVGYIMDLCTLGRPYRSPQLLAVGYIMDLCALGRPYRSPQLLAVGYIMDLCALGRTYRSPQLLAVGYIMDICALGPVSVITTTASCAHMLSKAPLRQILWAILYFVVYKMLQWFSQTNNYDFVPAWSVRLGSTTTSYLHGLSDWAHCDFVPAWSVWLGSLRLRTCMISQIGLTATSYLHGLSDWAHCDFVPAWSLRFCSLRLRTCMVSQIGLTGSSCIHEQVKQAWILLEWKWKWIQFYLINGAYVLLLSDSFTLFDVPTYPFPTNYFLKTSVSKFCHFIWVFKLV